MAESTTVTTNTQYLSGGMAGSSGGRVVNSLLGSSSLVKEFIMVNNFVLVLVLVLLIYLLFWCMNMSSSGFYTLSVIILLMIMYVNRCWIWMKDRDIIRDNP